MPAANALVPKTGSLVDVLLGEGELVELESSSFTTCESPSLKLTEPAVDFLVKHGYDVSYGARPLKRAIQRWIEDPLSEKILLAEFSRGDEIEVDVSGDGTKLEFRVPASSPKA